MNNIEKLAIERGAFELAVQNEGYDTRHLKYFDDSDSYEFSQVQDMWWAWKARAKAYAQQQTEPVGEVIIHMIGENDVCAIQWRDGYKPEVGDLLFTHPPATVPLEKYNKLLDALKDLFADYKALVDSGNAGFWELEETEIGKRTLQAIAEAEEKEG